MVVKYYPSIGERILQYNPDLRGLSSLSIRHLDAMGVTCAKDLKSITDEELLSRRGLGPTVRDEVRSWSGTICKHRLEKESAKDAVIVVNYTKWLEARGFVVTPPK